jgi:OOP family OmpA-OmpF porin
VRKHSFALKLAMLALPAVVSANEVDSVWLTPQLGYVWVDDKRRADDALSYGLTFGEQRTERIALESSIVKSEHDLAAGGRGSLLAVMVDGVFLFHNERRVTPFVSLGAGILVSDTSDASSQESIALETGVGARVRLWEGRGTALNLIPQLGARWDSNGTITDRTVFDFSTSVGLQWVWGGRVKSVAPAAPALSSAPVRTPPPPAPRPPPAVLPKSLNLQGGYFELNSATLTDDSHGVLDSAAADLAAHAELKVELQGHTDSSGSDAHNLDLSQRRAESVRDYLISRGVAAAQVTAKGYGEAQPIADNSTPAGRALNRRVVMVVIENPGNIAVTTDGKPIL